jgi:hypothetical protein
VDLTRALASDSVFRPTADPFWLSIDAKTETDLRYDYSADWFCIAESGGTHVREGTSGPASATSKRRNCSAA